MKTPQPHELLHQAQQAHNHYQQAQQEANQAKKQLQEALLKANTYHSVNKLSETTGDTYNTTRYHIEQAQKRHNNTTERTQQ